MTCGSVIKTASKTKQVCYTCWTSKLDKIENAAILSDFLKVLSWNVKTQEFCETSSRFERCNVKNEAILQDILYFVTWQRQNEAILRDFFIFQTWQHQKRSNRARLPSKMESWVQSWRPRANVFCDFYIPSVWSTAPATKKWCPVMRSAAPVTQNHSSKPENLMISNATPLRKAAPWPPDISDEHVFCTAPATRNASLPDPLQMFYACYRFWKCYKTSHFAYFWQNAESLAPATQKPHLNLQKWSEHVVF